MLSALSVTELLFSCHFVKNIGQKKNHLSFIECIFLEDFLHGVVADNNHISIMSLPVGISHTVCFFKSTAHSFRDYEH